MRYSTFNVQLRTLWYRSQNWLAGLDLNILVNMTDYFRLADFRATLCTGRAAMGLPLQAFFQNVLDISLIAFTTVFKMS
jgi:hypothetical protein